MKTEAEQKGRRKRTGESPRQSPRTIFLSEADIKFGNPKYADLSVSHSEDFSG